MTHDDGPRRMRQEFVDTARPGPVVRLLWTGHAGSHHSISSAQAIFEQWLPIHFASTSVGFTRAVNQENRSRHSQRIAGPMPIRRKRCAIPVAFCMTRVCLTRRRIACQYGSTTVPPSSRSTSRVK